ncbi:MAG: phosphoribosylglycinamide formyltransferase [Mangrovibacterium sp.]
MKRIALFASGTGSNALRFMQYFSINTHIKIDSVFTNNPKGGVIAHAQDNQVHLSIFSRQDFYESDQVLEELRQRQVDVIVLAGFLWLMPPKILAEFQVVNIHPSLLPKYGGKGMYGAKVHQAVIDNGEAESGITIHLVNEEYDKGEVLLQKSIPVLPDDTVQSLQERIHQLEYEYYPRVVENLIGEG